MRQLLFPSPKPTNCPHPLYGTALAPFLLTFDKRRAASISFNKGFLSNGRGSSKCWQERTLQDTTYARHSIIVSSVYRCNRQLQTLRRLLQPTHLLQGRFTPCHWGVGLQTICHTKSRFFETYGVHITSNKKWRRLDKTCRPSQERRYLQNGQLMFFWRILTFN